VTVRFIDSERYIRYTVLCFHTKDLQVRVRTEMEYWLKFPFGRMWFWLQDGLDFMIDLGSMTISDREGIVPVFELLNLPLVYH